MACGSICKEDESKCASSERNGDCKGTTAPKCLRRRSASMSSKAGSEKCPNFTVQRPALTVAQKHQQYQYSKPIEKGFRKSLRDKVRKETRCSAQRLKQTLFLRLPIIKWLLHYNIKKDLVADLVAGTTVAVMHIPHGMAYGMLAGLAPISGIYMAFFPVLVYATLASSRHCSMGTFAVVCLMTGNVVSEYAAYPSEVRDDTNTTEYPIINGTDMYTPTEVATILSFSCSIWMLLFVFLNIGSLSVFLSDMLISGFTTGAAFHVFTAQLKPLLGVRTKTYNGIFHILFTWKAVFEQILKSNPATMVISLIGLIVISFNNEIIKPRLSKVTKIPIPIELIAIVCGTLVSKYCNLQENYNIVVVGDVPTGLPAPELPPFSMLGKIFIPSLTITIVAYTVSISIAKIFAAKRDYSVDATQELYAMGLGNLVGSFFKCAPIAAALARSLIQFNVGGVTQLTSYVSCLLVLLILLYIGPFFEPLPNCVLAAIIIMALKGMFLQVYDFTSMWKISKREASVWLISFLGVVIIDIDYGLFIGIGCTILQLIYNSQIPTVTVLGRVPNTDIYLDKNRYASVTEIPGVKIFQVAGALHFANRESFQNCLIRASQIDPKVIIKMEKKEKKKLQKMLTKQASSKDPYQESYTNYAATDLADETATELADETATELRMESFCANKPEVDEGGTAKAYDKSIDELENNTEALAYTNYAATDLADETATELRMESICANKPEIDEGGTAKAYDKSIDELEMNSEALAYTDTKWLIVDFSGVGKMDVSGARNLCLVFKEFTDAHISLCCSSLSESCLEVMETCGALKDLPEDIFFHSVHDALSHVTGINPPVEKTPNTVNLM